MLSSAANLNRYAQLAQDMLPKNKPYVLVEGNNKFFYQDLEEFHDCFVKNGGNCENIKKQIEDKLTDRKKNYIGIIDNDYFFHPSRTNIFVIDYYSIENVSLLNFEQFSTLKKELEKFYLSNSLEDIQTFKVVGGFGKFDKSSNGVAPFKINFHSKYNASFESYTHQTITSLDSFFKYKDLKKTVENFANYYKNVKGKKNQINYIHDLSKALPNPSTEHIFDTKTNSLLQRTLVHIRKVDKK